MFKSVLNSLNGSNLTTEQQDLASREEQRQRHDSGSIHSDGSKTGALRLASVKRGRKKLTSMLSRLRSTGWSSRQVDEHAAGRGDRQELAHKQPADDSSDDDGDDQNNNNHHDQDEDEDDDDDAYKSAEEACRKLSISERPLDAAAPMGRRNSATKRQSSSAAGAYDEELMRSSKYILPEEQCDIPTFLHTKNCDPKLIIETRRLLKERYAKNAANFYDADYKRMLTDDWTVSRFLLRRRLDPKRTAKLMEECGRFRKQYKMSEVQLWEFPMEFHQAGGLFKYAPDRVGNVTMYMRVKMYRRVPEISDVFKAFILCVLEQCDVANNGRGTAVIFDLSGCGLQNVDLAFLSWLLSSFRNYCPKGVSYILVYNLPWILNATCKLAMTWMSASNKRALRFVYGDEIENFIPRANLPDYLGGTSKINYRAIPAGSRPAIEVCERLDMTREQAIKIRELFKQYLDDEQPDAELVAHGDKSALHDDANNNGGQQVEETKSSPSHELELERASRVPVASLVSQASKFVAH